MQLRTRDEGAAVQPPHKKQKASKKPKAQPSPPIKPLLPSTSLPPLAIPLPTGAAAFPYEVNGVEVLPKAGQFAQVCVY
jgi:hypothetical protein